MLIAVHRFQGSNLTGPKVAQKCGISLTVEPQDPRPGEWQYLCLPQEYKSLLDAKLEVKRVREAFVELGYKSDRLWFQMEPGEEFVDEYACILAIETERDGWRSIANTRPSSSDDIPF